MALRIPSPVALTKPEAYLAYKAGILSRGELKDKLLNPINNYEGWLAKWCELLETYPTNEDGTPQCLTDEEGLLAYLCGVTDRYPATNSRPDDARVSAYIRYLVSARYARPDHPLNREEFYLSLIKTQFVPSGNPSSDIVIDGTTKAPFLDVKVYGDTLQNSYSGKNLFNIARVNNLALGGTIVSGASYRGYSLSANAGDTFTLSRKNTTDNNRFRVAFTIDEPANGVAFYDKDGNPSTGKYIYTADTATSVTFTVPAGMSYAFIYLSNSRQTITESMQIQIEKGSTATDFEPYVGGIPAPNPDYPQPISVVTGEQTVKVVGKNLFRFTETRAVTASGVTFETTEGTSVLKINGTSTSSSNFSINLIRGTSPLTLEAGTYTIKIDGLNRITASTDYAYLGGVGIGAYVYLNPNNNWQATFTLTAKTSLYMQGVFASSTAYNNKEITIQLELGSTATTYQAYTSQDYTISLGPIELAKIGTYQDRIYKEGEKWYIEKQVGKVVLDGSESFWSTYGTNTSIPAYNAQISDCHQASDTGTVFDGLSNYYTPNTQGALYAQDIDGISYRINRSAILFKNTQCLDMASFRTWLSTHNTTVYYALATPTTTEITNQTLIDQLNALKQGGAEEGTTYIRVSATDPNLPAKLYVEAPKYD